jgi:hypothetical protein
MWYRTAQPNSSYYDRLMNRFDDDEKEVFSKLLSLRSAISSAAQKVYDDWDEEDIDTYGSGGICNYVAPAIASVVGQAFPQHTTLTQIVESPNHEYVQLILATEEDFYNEDEDKTVTVFDIDIPYHIYEKYNSEYNWSKIKDVIFNPDSVSIEMSTQYLSDLRYDY